MSKTKRHVALTYVAQGWALLLSVAAVPFFISSMSLEAYAFVGLLLAINSILSLIDVAATPLVTTEISNLKQHSEFSRKVNDGLCGLEMVCWLIAIVCYPFVYFIAYYVTNKWNIANHNIIDDLGAILIILSLIAIIRIPEAIYKAYSLGLESHETFTVVTLLTASIRWILGIWLVIVSDVGLYGFFACYLTASIIGVLIYRLELRRILYRKKMPKSYDFSVLIRHSTLAKGAIFIAMVSFLLTQLDKFLVAKTQAVSDFSYYSLCASAAAAIFVAVSPITQVAFPKLANAIATNEQADLSRIYHMSCKWIVIIAASIVFVGIYNAQAILLIWTRDNALAENAAALLRIMLGGVLFNAIAWGPYQLQLANGWTSLNLITSVYILPFYVALLWASNYYYGGKGAAFSVFVVNFIFAFVPTYVMHKRVLVGQYLSWFWRDVFMPILGAMIGVLIAAPFECLSDSKIYLIIYIAGSLFISIVSGFFAASVFRLQLTVKSQV